MQVSLSINPIYWSPILYLQMTKLHVKPVTRKNIIQGQILIRRDKAVYLWMTEMSFMENQCFLKERDSNACGVSRGVKEFVFVSDCNDNIRRHLTSFWLSKSNTNECNLILARVGMFCASKRKRNSCWSVLITDINLENFGSLQKSHVNTHCIKVKARL